MLTLEAGTMAEACDTTQVEAEGSQDLSRLQNEFKASLNNLVKPCLQKYRGFGFIPSTAEKQEKR